MVGNGSSGRLGCVRFLSILGALLCVAKAAGFSTVIIDPGHGGKDKGAFWGGIRESHLTLSVSQKLDAALRAKGIRTVMTRRSDVFVSLPRRLSIANSQRDAVLVSVHFNASRATEVRGVETYYFGPAGKKLAGSVQRRIAVRLGLRNRGIHRKAYSMLANSRHPAVLVECGFISNRSERGRCCTRSYQQGLASAICDGLLAYRSTR